MADYFTSFSCLLDVGAPENAVCAMALYKTLSEEDALDARPCEGFLLSVQFEDSAILWIRDDGGGDPESVVRFVKRCASVFHLSGYWGFQYANSCSKPRLDGFGGGAHVLDLATGETIACTCTESWLASVLAGGDGDA